MPATELRTACISCGNTSVANYFIKKNDSGEYPVVRCSFCGSAFVWPRPDLSTMASYYGDVSYSNLTPEEAVESDLRYYPNSAHDSGRILKQCAKLTHGKILLDVGAGFGMFSKTALQKGFNVAACEPNPNARKVFHRLNGFEPESCLFDKEFVVRHSEGFDVVLLSQVLEHVVEPEEIVINIRSVLKDKGIAVIAVPHFGSAVSLIQGKNDMFISPPEHLNFFSKKGLAALFERNHFNLEHIDTVSKVNSGKIRDAVHISILRDAVWMGLYSVLKVFEAFGMGMVINAYFRKAN